MQQSGRATFSAWVVNSAGTTLARGQRDTSFPEPIAVEDPVEPIEA
jgi:hypothetical protein